MTPPASSGHGSPSTTPRKRTCELWAGGCGATDVLWPITPIKPAFFERLAGQRLAEQLQGEEARSQFGRALQELGIEWIAAHSPQAKGRIERLFETLQDRLVKEMRLAGIDSIEAANHFLETRFLPEWEQRFTVAPRNARNAHRRLGREQHLEEILSVRVARKVAEDHTVSWDGNRWGVLREEVCAGLRGAQVEIERRLDGTHWLRFRGRYLHLRHCPEPPPRAEVLPAYGLQDLPQINYQEFTKVLLRTIHGGHFNMAEKRTFLICVDRLYSKMNAREEGRSGRHMPEHRNPL